MFGKFPTQKNPKLKISNLPKILRSFLSLDYMEYLPGCFGKRKKKGDTLKSTTFSP